MEEPAPNQRAMLDAEYVPLAVEITVSEFDQSLSFYRDKLRFEVARIHKEAEYTFASLFFRGSLLMIKQDNRAQKPQDPIMQIRFILPSQEELERYHEKVQQSGASIFKPLDTQYYGLYRFSVKDPDGYEIKFGAKP